MEAQIQASGLEKSLIELVKTRASQIIGSAYCINMHTADARKQGETEQRLYLLNAWRESPLYTDRERAATMLIGAINAWKPDCDQLPRDSSGEGEGRSGVSQSPSSPG